MIYEVRQIHNLLYHDSSMYIIKNFKYKIGIVLQGISYFLRIKHNALKKVDVIQKVYLYTLFFQTFVIHFRMLK